MKGLTLFTATVLLCLGLSLNAFAQNAVMNGTVSDATGALIPGVEVTATNVNTGIVTTTMTNEAGAYNFPSVQPGRYNLSAALPGFQTATYNNIQLSQAQQVRLNFTLQVGTLATGVEVTTDADAALATTSASVGDVLPQMEVSSLPLATRNVIDLISTTAGAVDNFFGGQRRSSLNTTRDGLPVNDNRNQGLTGATTATYTSPELVEEVQVVVGSIDAEAGRGPGQIRLQTRSGTNEFHGAVFYSNNNSALKAFNYFDKLGVRNPQKSYTNQHQYGGRLGGPIVRNKAFFFVLIDNQRYLTKQNFVSGVLTNEARNGNFRYFPGRLNGNIFSSTPSVDAQGNPLPSIGTPVSFNVFTDVRDPFRTGMDSSGWMQKVLARMPQPNDFTIGDGLNTAGFRWQRRINGLGQAQFVGETANRDQFNLRLDYQVNNANKLTFTMSREKDWALNDFVGIAQWPGGFNGEIRYWPDTYTGAWTSTISPTLLNEFRIGRKETSLHTRSPFHVGCCFDESITDASSTAREALSLLPKINGFPLFPASAVVARVPFLPYTNPSTTRGHENPLWMFSDSVSWTTGAHSLKSGVELVRLAGDGWNMGGGIPVTILPEAIIGDGNFPVRGIDSTRFSGLQATDARTAQNVLNDLAGSVGTLRQAFLINSPTATDWTNYNQEFRRFRKWNQNDWSVFVKDTWTATQNLTLNFGLRYDKYGVLYESSGFAGRAKGGQAGIFGISGTDYSAMWNPGATGGSLTQIEFVGKNSPNPDITWYPEDWNNFAPSFGFSWNVPWFARETVVRGGYGINYSAVATLADIDSPFGSIPGLASVMVIPPASYTNLSTIALPLTPSAPPFAVNPLTDRTGVFLTMADNRSTPYIQNWNLSIQRELDRNMSVEVAYIGNKGNKLYQPIELNEPNILAAWNGSETFLEAFNTMRAGGNAALFNRMLMGIDLDGSGPIAAVNGTTQTGSAALRAFGTTDNWVADGAVAQLAEWMNSTNTGTRVNGGLIRTNRFPENFLYVNPQFEDAQIWGNNSDSTYHSMQLQLTRRLSSGFSGQVSYTWSKALGNALTDRDNGDTVVDPRNRQLNHGRLTFDRTQSIRSHGTWQLPFGPNQMFLSGAPNWVHRIVEGWQLSGIMSWNSGAPLDITHTVDTVGSNSIRNHVDMVGAFPKDIGNVQVGDGFVQYFEGISTRPQAATVFGSDPNQLRADFGNREVVDSSGNVLLRVPDPGNVGTLGVNYIEGPGRFGLDMALMKRVQISEGKTFQIRADAINILNRPQWGNPAVNINSNNFGRITSSTGARTVTINARIDF